MHRTRAICPSSVNPKLLMWSSDSSHKIAVGRSLTPAVSASAPAAPAWPGTHTAHISTVLRVSRRRSRIGRLHQPSAHAPLYRTRRVSSPAAPATGGLCFPPGRGRLGLDESCLKMGPRDLCRRRRRLPKSSDRVCDRISEWAVTRAPEGRRNLGDHGRAGAGGGVRVRGEPDGVEGADRALDVVFDCHTVHSSRRPMWNRKLDPESLTQKA
jgi:hypothetical protein